MSDLSVDFKIDDTLTIVIFITTVRKAAIGWVYKYPNITFNLPNNFTGYVKAVSLLLYHPYKKLHSFRY